MFLQISNEIAFVTVICRFCWYHPAWLIFVFLYVLMPMGCTENCSPLFAPPQHHSRCGAKLNTLPALPRHSIDLALESARRFFKLAPNVCFAICCNIGTREDAVEKVVLKKCPAARDTANTCCEVISWNQCADHTFSTAKWVETSSDHERCQSCRRPIRRHGFTASTLCTIKLEPD